MNKFIQPFPHMCNTPYLEPLEYRRISWLTIEECHAMCFVLRLRSNSRSRNERRLGILWPD